MQFWIDFEKFVGEIPNDTKEILTVCGYDNLIALSEIDDKEISVIENYVNQNGKIHPKIQQVLQRRDLEIFSFLPGHRKLLNTLAQKAKQKLSSEKESASNKTSDCDLSNATFIMKELINSMRDNANIPVTGHRYSEAIQWFGTYIYMLSGKAAYEVLCNNLPLPKDSTICKKKHEYD